MPLDDTTGVYFELHGPQDGEPLFLGFPLMARAEEFMGAGAEAVLKGFLPHFTDRYRVLVADYPSIGRSVAIDPLAFTADRVVRDYLGVATAAGFDRFALFGFSWGAAAAKQVAARTDRVTALAIGGWPPLEAPYADILRATLHTLPNPGPEVMVVLRDKAQYAQWSTFYRSLEGWSEGEAMAALTCPRLVFVGSEGDVETGGVSIPIASIVRRRRTDLEAQGWKVEEIPGQPHGVGVNGAVVGPIVRAFLDGALGLSAD